RKTPSNRISGAAPGGRFPSRGRKAMSSNPQTVNITATYYPNINTLSFSPAPPFTSDQSVTDFVFTLGLGEGFSGTLSWADPAVAFFTPAPSPPWTVTVNGQTLTIQ